MGLIYFPDQQRVASPDGLDGGSDGQDIVAFLKSLLSTYLVREPARDPLRVADFTGEIAPGYDRWPFSTITLDSRAELTDKSYS